MRHTNPLSARAVSLHAAPGLCLKPSLATAFRGLNETTHFLALSADLCGDRRGQVDLLDAAIREGVSDFAGLRGGIVQVGNPPFPPERFPELLRQRRVTDEIGIGGDCDLQLLRSPNAQVIHPES